MRSAIPILLVVSGLFGCRSVYHLPPPPEPHEIRAVQLNPAEGERVDAAEEAALDREARRVVLGVYGAIGTGDFDQVYGLLSNETRILLDDLGDVPGEQILAGATFDADGQAVMMDPIECMLVPDLLSAHDRMNGEEEHETAQRREIWLEGAVSTRKVVVIQEGGIWLLHQRTIPRECLTLAETS